MPPRLLVRPGPEHLASCAAALARGWTPNTTAGPEAAAEELARLRADPAAYLALMDDPLATGGPVTLPDGSQVARIPSLRRWIWDGADEADGGPFAGSIGLRWTADGSPLPPHVLGHIGYAVVPWKRRRGLATRALSEMLDIARERGLRLLEITTDPDNTGSQRVIEANGGVRVGAFDKGAAYGHAPGWRYRIELKG
jgi:predicted acetyltransferase